MALRIEADLPAEPAGLKDVDALLRCPICFDFLNISMMTKCSHNFCSLCIRKFLSYKLQCPLCNTQTTEQDLRNNRLLDDLVATFKATRQQLSKATFDSPPISPKTPASAVKCRTPKERRQKCTSSVLNHFFQKRPKASSAKESQHDSSVAQPIQRGEMQTARTHNANDADLHSAAAPLPVVVKEEPMDVKVASVYSLMSVKQEDMGTHTESSWDEKAHSSSPPQDVKPVIKVDCPVCSVGVSQQFINKHLDTCLFREEKKESLRSSFGKSMRPMAKLVYNLLSMHELKRRLKECHLSVHGSRDQLIKRHQEFVHRYNAQCDSLNPKSAEDIAKELEANEKIRNQLQGKIKPVMVFSKNQSEKEIDEMHSNYRKQHSSDFSRLIAQVRGRLEPSKRVKQDVIVEGKDAPKTHCAVAESQTCFVMKLEDEESDKEKSVRRIEAPTSPTYSDVSISSSVSDIFGPEPAVTFEDAPRTPVHKRTSSSRGDDAASPPALGKRRRKK
ncbi:E3 ubiquitin-protein ligase RAD18 [Collichthys lucidus]|uniref:RING-type E3 ubiquitin transferase n=1 Tax=Collichthys lucidus TaxID=240159 RepID=A0A4U5UB71_COLLU|nr:E3 ubiquitin-protein ligase RAD18 [Collichthys lucidus]